jgi:hypothetical protein
MLVFQDAPACLRLFLSELISPFGSSVSKVFLFSRVIEEWNLQTLFLGLLESLELIVGLHDFFSMGESCTEDFLSIEQVRVKLIYSTRFSRIRR